MKLKLADHEVTCHSSRIPYDLALGRGAAQLCCGRLRWVFKLCQSSARVRATMATLSRTSGVQVIRCLAVSAAPPGPQPRVAPRDAIAGTGLRMPLIEVEHERIVC